jgi:hypothetical protein
MAMVFSVQVQLLITGIYHKRATSVAILGETKVNKQNLTAGRSGVCSLASNATPEQAKTVE